MILPQDFDEGRPVLNCAVSLGREGPGSCFTPNGLLSIFYGWSDQKLGSFATNFGKVLPAFRNR
jgi:hypothetical protein